MLIPTLKNSLLHTADSSLENLARMCKFKLPEGYTTRELQEPSSSSMIFAVKVSRSRSWYITRHYTRLGRIYTDGISLVSKSRGRWSHTLWEAAWTFETRWYNWYNWIPRPNSTKDQDRKGRRGWTIYLCEGSYTFDTLSPPIARWILSVTLSPETVLSMLMSNRWFQGSGATAPEEVSWSDCKCPFHWNAE